MVSEVTEGMGQALDRDKWLPIQTQTLSSTKE